MAMNLVLRWQQTWLCSDADAPSGLIDRIEAAYREAQRAYHTLQHIGECFGHLDASPTRADDPLAVELALWFHDAVYDTKAADSEARSAAWAREALSGVLTEQSVARIEQLVLVTQHNAAPTTADQELLLDIDLSILGASPSRFSEYEAQVREEYRWVPEEAYRTARANVLREFHRRSTLYHTAHFREMLETQARENLQRSLDALSE